MIAEFPSVVARISDETHDVLIDTFLFIIYFFAGLLVAVAIIKFDKRELYISCTRYGDRMITNLLLPIILYCSLILDKNQSLTAGLIQAALVFGILIWWVTYLTARYLFPPRIFGQESRYLPFVVSSFGGGNRGVLIILLLFLIWPFLEDTPLLPTFFLVDLGYFISLLVFGQVLIRRAYSRANSGAFIYFWSKLRGVIPIVVGLLAGRLLDPVFSQETVDMLKNVSGGLLAFLMPLLVYLRASKFDENISTGVDIRYFFVTRIIVFAMFFVVVILLQSDGFFFGIQISILSLLGIIFVILPPSSLIGSMLEEGDMTKYERVRANKMIWRLNVAYIYVYVSLLIAVFVWHMIR